MERRYDHDAVERRWQRTWRDRAAFRTPEDPESPEYVLSMFPYTSGEMHMGHVRNYAITDAYSVLRRMQGADVLHPMGWDAFGLPAENAAVERDTTPREWTERCIGRMRDQFDVLGLGFDWDRELTTCDPEYYRWNQWLFARLREAGLVDRRAGEVNWCPDCDTSLADAQVETEDGQEVCWRCETPVTTRSLLQWYVRTTEYADELADHLEDLTGWPDHVREMQREWIGRQEGATVTFELDDGTAVETFTTRVDTLFGVTFLAVAPSHPVADAAADREDAVAKYVTRVADHPDDADPGYDGVDTGVRATHPATGASLPVYVADFVVGDVGTGAVMGVPAHDDRDFRFAREQSLPVRPVVAPEDAVAADGGTATAQGDVETPYTGEGRLVDSGEFSGTDSERARELIPEGVDAVERDRAYRLDDWLISRQRYWGTPIPVVHCEACGPVTVPDEALPVELPEYVETTGNPLAAADEWVETECPECGRPARRETDTMDTFVDSSWYFARFAAPTDDAPFDPDRVDEWLPVDHYVGGVEHAVLHLLYARFVTKALRDLGHVDVSEPFERLTCQGMVLRNGEKMSKSKGNGVSPEAVVSEYGADTARLFTLRAAHPERDFDWTDEGVESARATLDRAVRVVEARGEATREERRPADDNVARTVDAAVSRATDAYESMAFHRAIQTVEDLLGTLDRYRTETTPHGETYRRGVRVLVRVLAPVAPHVAEELWTDVGDGDLVIRSDWPTPDGDVADRERRRSLIETTEDDVREICSVAGIDAPESIQVVVASDWKREVTRVARDHPDDPVPAVMSDPDLRERGDEAVTVARKTATDGADPLPTEREREILERAAWLLAAAFDADVVVRTADDPDADPDAAGRALPARPGIAVRE